MKNTIVPSVLFVDREWLGDNMHEFSNITVLALEQATVVPYLTYRMAMDGMEIIRLEHPVYGDPNRTIGDNVLGESRMNSYYLCINAGKKSLSLNLANPKGKEILAKLISELDVDIFVTNQLPKNYDKLGINYERLRSIKENVIWVGITGFGPNSNEGAYDPILQARSGLMDLTGEPGGSPQVLGIPLPDMGTSEHAYGLIMKALYKREVSGNGSQINLSMFESSVSWLTVAITMTSTFGKNVTRRGNTHEFFSPVSVYQTEDGHIYLAIGSDRQWDKMVDSDLFKSLNQQKYEKNTGRIKDVEALNKAISSITIQHKSSDLIAFFNGITVPVSNINSVTNMIEDPAIKNKLIRTIDFKTKQQIVLAPPPNATDFLRANNNTMRFPPRFGEHNEMILRQIGYTTKDAEQFGRDGII